MSLLFGLGFIAHNDGVENVDVNRVDVIWRSSHDALEVQAKSECAQVLSQARKLLFES